MRLTVGIAGHICVDHLTTERFDLVSLGGPPCYAGLTARRFGCSVTLVTKIGYDFPEKYSAQLLRGLLRIPFNSRSASKPTTRFRIVQTLGRRELYLLSRCEGLSPSQLDSLTAEALIVSPVAGEVSEDFLERASKACPRIFLDPQGFLRSFAYDGRCSLASVADIRFLKHAGLMKVDEEECLALTGKKGIIEGIKALRQLGVKNIIATRGSKDALLLNDQKVYSIPVPKVEVVDSTGAGDILSGAFMASLLRSGDPLWSACVGVAASSSSLGRIGLSKIPRLKDTLQGAEKLKREARKVYSL